MSDHTPIDNELTDPTDVSDTAPDAPDAPVAPSDVAPVEDAPDAPVAPSDVAPVEDAPAAVAPVEDAPDAPVAPSDVAPVEDAPAAVTPVEKAPAEETEPIADAPAEDARAESAPVADDPTVKGIAEPTASDGLPGDAAGEPAAAEQDVPAVPDAIEGDAVVTDAAAAPDAFPGAPAQVDQEAPGEEPVVDEQDTTTSQEAPAPAVAPSPMPSAAPRPSPRPMPRPPTPGVRPAATATGGATAAGAATAPPTAPAPPALTPAENAEAARWGRVDDDGTVWVREPSGERTVGQYPGAEPADALAFYVRRFADLHAKVILFEARLTATDLSVKEIDNTIEHLSVELAEPAAVGDLESLRIRLEGLKAVAAQRRAVAEAERAAAKQVALEARTAIVEAAEKIAATDPERIQWRPAGEELRTFLDQWKDAQRHGPRVDRGAEDALWKRFSHARSTFDRERRRYFSELEKTNATAKAEKAGLVAEAEALATSTDWAGTTSAYRDLMARWKTAGRASRKDDDALWAQFRAAQDTFFAARDVSQKETDAEFATNLKTKLALLDEAEKIVPVRDLAAARAALRDLQERWERAGKVPRGDIQRVEGRLRAVEQAVRDAEQNQWQRSNPETRARAEGAAAQLLAAISGLEADLARAQSAGDARKVAEAQSALDARRAWLEQVQRAAVESRG